MKVKKGNKYKVVTEVNHFKTLNDLTEREGFILFEGEEYTVDMIYDMDGKCFVNLGQYKDEFGQNKSRTLSLDTFKNCFDEVK